MFYKTWKYFGFSNQRNVITSLKKWFQKLCLPYLFWSNKLYSVSKITGFRGCHKIHLVCLSYSWINSMQIFRQIFWQLKDLKEKRLLFPHSEIHKAHVDYLLCVLGVWPYPLFPFQVSEVVCFHRHRKKATNKDEENKDEENTIPLIAIPQKVGNDLGTRPLSLFVFNWPDSKLTVALLAAHWTKTAPHGQQGLF